MGLALMTASDAQATEQWRILALRVSFPKEEPDHSTTTGDGTFDLRPFEGEVKAAYRFPYDVPPHDKGFYELHLEALTNYYRTVSEGHVEITFDVLPHVPDSSYRLSRTMIDYGSGRTQEAQDRKLVELFRDAVTLADSVEGGRLDFSPYQSFLVIHAGGGKESSGALNDIPSAYLSMEDLERHIGGPIQMEHRGEIRNGWIVPESVGFQGNGGLNGLMVKMFGHQLGLPVLSNLRDGLPALGGWSLMDVGDMNASAVLAVRDSAGAARGDSSMVAGFVPCHPMAWSKVTLGWLEPLVVRRDTTMQIAAAHIISALPKVVQVPLNAREYFLLENREAHYSGKGLPDGVTFSNPADSSGVWMAVANYDAFIPGSGIFIYHIDEQVIEQGRATNRINAEPMHRGIDLEEADGGEDIGNPHRVYADWGHPDWEGIDGEPGDAFFAGGRTAFGPDTTPSSVPYGGADSGCGSRYSVCVGIRWRCGSPLSGTCADGPGRLRGHSGTMRRYGATWTAMARASWLRSPIRGRCSSGAVMARHSSRETTMDGLLRRENRFAPVWLRRIWITMGCRRLWWHVQTVRFLVGGRWMKMAMVRRIFSGGRK